MMEATDRTARTPERMTRLVLASGSPRRRAMLEHAGIDFEVRPAPIDDGELDPPPRVDPPAWVMALAHLKARATLDACQREPLQGVIVLGADTVCVHGGAITGQPSSRTHARAMIETMRDATHEVLTGVALLSAAGDTRDLFVDRSVVRVGAIDDDEIERYLDSGAWAGKAGAYNIADRRAAGWAIQYDGTEESIMGLPLARVLERLETLLCGDAA